MEEAERIHEERMAVVDQAAAGKVLEAERQASERMEEAERIHEERMGLVRAEVRASDRFPSSCF